MTDTTDTPSLRPRAALYGPIAAVAGFYAIAGWQRRWVSDDAFITLRCVRNLLEGNGPVFNAGERVEASTSTAWELVLAVVGVTRGIVPLEWWSVVLGLAMAVAGLALGQLGALRLLATGDTAGGTDGPRIAVPLGALVVVAIPPFWDFATSGLETGMAFGWLGLCFWGLVRAGDRAAPTVPRWLAVAIGVGPLVRPDLLVPALGFAALALLLQRTRRVALLAWMAALPAAYELFRMAYYAALVPNPAMAKEASRAWWSQGRDYFTDFVGPYWLWLPVVACAVAAALLLHRADWTRLALALVPVAAGLLHALFVVRVGGDFMHARLLLPSLFMVLLPLMAVPASRAVAAPALVVAVWAVVCGVALRAHDGLPADDLILDERAFYVAAAKSKNPVTLNDFKAFANDGAGRAVKARADAGERRLLAAEVPDGWAYDEPLPDAAAEQFIARRGNVGVFGYAVGSDVYVADVFGLGDPLASRLHLGPRGRPGHEKYLPLNWHLAQFGGPDAAMSPTPQTFEAATAEEVAAARRAIECTDLDDVLDAIRKPLTPSRALRNIASSFRFTRLRFHGNAALNCR